MKRRSAGTYPTYAQASKRSKRSSTTNARGKKSVARARGGQVTSEMKYMDSNLAGSVIAQLGTSWANTRQDPATTVNLGSAAVANPLCLCAPIPGSALNNRIGRQIEVRKIKVHGFLNVQPNEGETLLDPNTKIRVLLVQDMQTNSSQMDGVDLLGPATANGSEQINCFQDPKNFGRFRVLKDKFFQISDLNMGVYSVTNAVPPNPNTLAFAQEGKIINFKFNVNFKQPVRVRFNAGVAGTVADIVDNSFHIIAGQVNATSNCAINYWSRVCYKDA